MVFVGTSFTIGSKSNRRTSTNTSLDFRLQNKENIYMHPPAEYGVRSFPQKVFLRYFGPFSNQRPFQSLHTRVCSRTSLCVKYLKNTTVPRWTNSKEDLIWLLMLKEAIFKNEVIDWFVYIYFLLYCIFVCYLYIFWIINKAKRSPNTFRLPCI